MAVNKGTEKVAVILMLLGEEIASKVVKLLSPQERETVIATIADNSVVPRDVSDNIVKEAYAAIVAGNANMYGGTEYARKILEYSEGVAGATKLMTKWSEAGRDTDSFGFLNDYSVEGLTDILSGETPQTIALVLSQVAYNIAAGVIENLSEEKKKDVIWRLAQIEKTSPDIMAEIKQSLRKKTVDAKKGEATSTKVKLTAEILNRVRKKTRDEILQSIEGKNGELAQKIKDSLFEFEDILPLGDKAMQVIVREIDPKELAVALKIASPELKEKIFKNMSENAAQMLKEEMDFLGPTKISEVENMQRKIISKIQELDQAGTIVLVTAGDELI